MLRLNVTLGAASPRNAETLLEGLQYQVAGTRLEHGCLGCGAWLGEDSKVQYYEDWATEDDLRRRVQSGRFTSLLEVVETAAEAEVQFDFVNKTRGLDYVAELREQSSSESMPPLGRPPSGPRR
jgi:quinol monooxygenase YgiN